jgi:Permease family
MYHYIPTALPGKVGGFIASIPDVMVAALLCFMWAMLAALGLSNLRYSASGSSRNSIVIGLALFFSLSVPAYFQQYGLHPNSNMSVPSYFQPYIVASHGPFHTRYDGVCPDLIDLSFFLSLYFFKKFKSIKNITLRKKKNTMTIVVFLLLYSL